jgi:hypothetical protein
MALLFFNGGCSRNGRRNDGGRSTGYRSVESEFVFETAPFASAHASTIVETRRDWSRRGLAARVKARPTSASGCRGARASAGRPIEVATGAQPDGARFPCWNPVLFEMPDKTLTLFYKVGPTPQSWWGMVRTSRDSGQTWSDARRLPDGILGPIKNKPVRLPDGTLVGPSSTESPERPSRWRVHFERSVDAGMTWTAVDASASADGSRIDAIQPSILIHPGGKLQAIGRTRSGRVFETWSGDGKNVDADGSDGAAESGPASRHDVARWPPDRLQPHHTGRSPLNVSLSRDGRTWEAALVLERSQARSIQPSFRARTVSCMSRTWSDSGSSTS